MQTNMKKAVIPSAITDELENVYNKCNIEGFIFKIEGFNTPFYFYI